MNNLDKKDRLVLINQYKILAALDKDDRSHYDELIQILENGYTIFYSMLDQWMSDDMPPEACRFVLDTLDLYRALDDVKRSTKDKRIENHSYSIFRGFDGNNETEYMGFCRFLIETQGKFSEQKSYLLKNDNMNSHMPMAPKYRRMLSTWNEIEEKWSLTADQAIQIMEA
jgi:uncharacterized protein YfbU (UPF0304 family)